VFFHVETFPKIATNRSGGFAWRDIRRDRGLLHLAVDRLRGLHGDRKRNGRKKRIKPGLLADFHRSAGAWLTGCLSACRCMTQTIRNALLQRLLVTALHPMMAAPAGR
jgi:hypothetical protein